MAQDEAAAWAEDCGQRHRCKAQSCQCMDCVEVQADATDRFRRAWLSVRPPRFHVGACLRCNARGARGASRASRIRLRRSAAGSRGSRSHPQHRIRGRSGPAAREWLQVQGRLSPRRRMDEKDEMDQRSDRCCEGRKRQRSARQRTRRWHAMCTSGASGPRCLGRRARGPRRRSRR
eukprot:1654294-Pleurochrysis_carterae.AAC.2